MLKLNLSLCNLSLLLPVLSLWLPVNTEPSPFSRCPFQYWNTVMMSSLSQLFSKFKDSTPSVLPHRGGSPALWLPSWPAFGSSQVCPCLLWIVGTRAGHCTPGLISKSLSLWMKPRVPFILIYLHLSSFTFIYLHYCSRFTAGTCWATHPPCPRVPFSKAAPHPHRPACKGLFGDVTQGQESALVFVKLHPVFTNPLFQPIQVSLRSLPSDVSSSTPSSVSSEPLTVFCQCFQSCHPDRLGRCCQVWSTVPIPGGPH